MKTNRSIKKDIEEFWGELFADALKSYYVDSEEINYVKSQTDPPDARYNILYACERIIHTWAEITNVYPSNAAAERLFREVKEGQKTSKTEQGVDGLWINTDLEIAETAIQLMITKIQKKSYRELCEDHGKGHLLLVIPYQSYPLVNLFTAQCITEQLPQQCLEKQPNFCSVWLAYKQPDHDDGVNIIHLPDSDPSYAFVPLWPNRDSNPQ